MAIMMRIRRLFPGVVKSDLYPTLEATVQKYIRGACKKCRRDGLTGSVEINGGFDLLIFEDDERVSPAVNPRQHYNFEGRESCNSYSFPSAW